MSSPRLLLNALGAIVCAIAVLYGAVGRADEPGDTGADGVLKRGLDESVLDKQDRRWGFELTYLDESGTLTYRELAESGEPFVLIWWNSECPHCRRSLPYVAALHKFIEQQGLALRMVSISTDSERATAQAYAKQYKIGFPVLLDGEAARTEANYAVKSRGLPIVHIFRAGGDKAAVITEIDDQFSRHVLRALSIPWPAETATQP